MAEPPLPLIGVSKAPRLSPLADEHGKSQSPYPCKKPLSI